MRLSEHQWPGKNDQMFTMVSQKEGAYRTYLRVKASETSRDW